MLMLRAYFDESGDPTNPGAHAFSVGGCMAPLEYWEAFETEWRQALDDEGLSWFHMTDFENYRREFSGWDERRHRDFLQRLLTIIDRSVQVHVGAAKILCSDIADPDWPTTYRNTYYNCVQVCVHGALREASYLPPEEKVRLVFAHHPQISPVVLEACNEALREGFSRLGSITQARVREVLPLQAADLVAYELNKAVSDPSRKRFPYEQLQRKPCRFVLG